jgi:hypothetical protein
MRCRCEESGVQGSDRVMDLGVYNRHAYAGSKGQAGVCCLHGVSCGSAVACTLLTGSVNMCVRGLRLEAARARMHVSHPRRHF